MNDTWVELRVHGVSGTPPGSILDRPHVLQVGGDHESRFFRSTDETGEELRGHADQILEGYHWGRLTSGSRFKALWLFLLPFGMVNAAHYMLPPVTRGKYLQLLLHALCDGVMRFVAILLTAMYAFAAGLIFIDLIGWRWASQNDLLQRLRPSWVLTVGVVLGVVVVLLLAFLARGYGHASGTTPPQRTGEDQAPDTPLATENFTPIINAVAESDCDLLFLCSYLADSVGLVRTIHTQRFRPRMVGGAMIGPQNTSIRTALGPLLNGLVNYEYWVPVPKMMFHGVRRMIGAYQERAGKAGVDPLGHYMAPLAYAQMQVVAQAIEATGGLDDIILSTFTSEETFDTVMGEVRFGKNGEWAQPRVLQVQFRDVAGHEADQFKDGSRQVVVSPSRLASGQLIFPYAEALQSGR
jgi:hypothetical protein